MRPARQRAHTENPLSVWVQVAVLAPLTLFTIYIYQAQIVGEGYVWALNFLLPIALLAASGLYVYKAVTAQAALFWTPAVMFGAHTMIFKGLGPLVHLFGNEDTQDKLFRYAFTISERELLGTNLLNCVATVSVLIGISFAVKKVGVISPRSLVLFSKSQQYDVPRIAAVFILVGLFLRYALVLPYQFGTIDVVIPGVLVKMSDMSVLGVALAGYVAISKSGSRWRLIFWCLLVLQLFTSLLEFSKSAVVLSLLLPALGTYLAHRNPARLLGWLLVVVVFFGLMQPYVSYGRNSILEASGSIDNATIVERLKIASEFLSGQGFQRVAGVTQQQSGWLRISYAGQQAFAMSARENGVQFDSLSNVWMSFIPRAVWPSKPITGGHGIRFYELVTGRSHSRTGITVYADLYWNFGWAGLIASCFVLGGFFGKISEHVYVWLSTEQFLYYPAIFVVLDMVMRGMNSWIAKGIFGALPLFFFVLMLTAMLGRVRFFRRGNA